MGSRQVELLWESGTLLSATQHRENIRYLFSPSLRFYNLRARIVYCTVVSPAAHGLRDLRLAGCVIVDDSTSCNSYCTASLYFPLPFLPHLLSSLFLSGRVWKLA